MARTKQRKPAVSSGRDTFHVVGPGGELAVKGEAAHALVVAQRKVKTELTVERRSLFGPAATLYRITFDPHDRIVRTYIVNAED